MMPNSRITIESVNPDGRTLSPIALEYSVVKLHNTAKFGTKGSVMEAAELVPFTLQHPSSIFSGLRYHEDEVGSSSPGWLCYCSRPAIRFLSNGREDNPKPEQVFLVFVNADKIIFNWRWEKADLEHLIKREYLPVNFADRFKERKL